MKKYIAILRGINVGGKRKILMADLRALLESKGFENVSTYIQSGNVFYNYKKNIKSAAMEKMIHDAIAEKYGFDVPVIVRTKKEIEQAILDCPFPTEEINKLYLTFFKSQPEIELVESFNEMTFGEDKFHIKEKEAYILYADRYSKSKLTNNLLEKKLKVTATTRNWKTTLKLVELAGE